MSERSQSLQPNKKAKAVLAVTAATALLAAAQSKRLDFSSPSGPTPVESIQPELASASQPESITFSQEPSQTFYKERAQSHEQIPIQIQKFINANAVYLDGPGCSGLFIPNTKGEDVAVATAGHCGLRYGSNPSAYVTAWIPSTNGHTYMLKSGGVRASAGNNMSNLRAPEGISSFVLPAEDNVDIDQALGVIPGYSAEEALDSYQKMLLSPEEINKLIPNVTKIWAAGWPLAQKGDASGNKLRQQFDMTYIGQMTTQSKAGENINVVLAAVARDSNGAVCSPGSSGSGGLVWQAPSKNKPKGAVRSVGPLSVGWPLKDGSPDSIAYLEYFKTKYPDVDWGKYDTVCGFATKSLKAQHVIVNVADNINEIPNPQVNNQLTAQTLFFNRDYTPTIINGRLAGALGSSSDGQNSKGVYGAVIEKPVLFLNNDGSAAIGYYYGGQLELFFYPNTDNLRFYQNDPSTPLSIVRTKSTKFNDPKPGDPNDGSFVDANGYEFGAYDNQRQPLSDQLYQMKVENGHIQFTPTLG